MKKKLRKATAEVKAVKKLISNPAALDEKNVALSILKQSPKGYRFFRKLFILPAPQTLVNLIQQSNLRPGLNRNIFSQLQKKTEAMKLKDKLCLLIFDEISLKARFVDNGQHRKPEFADHAQVFMVLGLVKNYKQPVSYTFTASATKGPELAKQMKEIVTELQEAGLIVVATVCDQGTNNRQAIKLLINGTRGVCLRRGETAKENIILIYNQEIVSLYDPPPHTCLNV
uniref:SFRICE_013393 n=1 Tax=Spodoptera frugiperda TaxID=7108 RepID=A0A2H1WNY7_SPOFR